MDNEVKQRNRRRKRAQRMQAQREASNKQKDASGAQDSGEDESPIREKPQRPPNRRKKSKEPLVEEDIVDGFSILGFRTYEDLEAVIRLATKTGVRCLTAPVIDEKFRSEKLELEKEKQRNKEINSLSTTLNNHHHIPLTHTQTHVSVPPCYSPRNFPLSKNSNLTLSHDPGTSDDSGRASERLTGSSVAPRDPDSSRDRLSDASSRCSSGKGYICDSEGEDDKFPVVAAEPTPSVSATYNNVTPNPTLKSIAPTKKVSESISKSVIQPKVSKTVSAQSSFTNHVIQKDTGSDAGSVLFASTPAPARKLEFPSALSIGNGDSAASPVPAPTPPSMAPPTPSPAPAALPPPQQSYTTPPSAAAQHPPVQPLQPQPQSQQQPPPPRLQSPPPTCAAAVAVSVTVTRVATPPISVPVTMPQPAPAAAPAPVVHLPPALDSTADVSHGRTDSPAVATSANAAVAPGSGGGSSYPAFPSLYAPYAVHSPYTAPSPAPAPASLTNAAPPVPTTTSSAVVNVPPPVTVAAVTVTTTSHRDTVTSTRTHSPRGHSPTRERDSYSSNVSSLSRGSLTPFSTAAPSVTVSSSLAFSKPTPSVWPTTPTSTAVTSQLSPATSVPRPTPPLASMHPFSAPMFAPPPLPPPVSTASPLGLPTNSVPNPNPFSAESLFQTNQTDMLRRELDNRFLASQDRSMNVGPPPYLRAEMHQHQHHHTHVHQHTTPLLPPPPASSLFPAPLFKDIPKMGSVDSPFYRQNLGLSSYPGYSGLLHPGLGGPTPFVPPNHLPTFQPKQSISDASKLKPIVKTGKWNAMHVRVAWEIYHSQQKQQSEVKAGLNTKADLLRPPSHMFPGSLIHSARPHELSYPPSLAGHRPPTFDPQPHHGSLFTNPTSHLVHRTAPGSGISPFSRYGTAFNAPGSPFTMSPFPSTRDLPPLGLHDPWRLQRTVPGFPAPVPQSPWGLKPDPAVLERREQEEREREQRERERERCRREREERERREREEKQRKQLEQQQQQERERERREKERREMERREMERERERERERILHQQRLAESNKQAAALAARDRSPLRNGTGDINEVRVKEEPRTKDDDVVLLSRTTDHRYHPYLNRHASNTLPPHASVLDRSRNMLPPLPGPPLSSHYAPPPTTHWPTGPDPYGYRFDHLRYNPLMEAAIRVEEERAKMFSAYNAHNNHLRGKDPGPPTGLLHMRPGTGPGPPPHKLCATPPNNDMHKKDDSSQSR